MQSDIAKKILSLIDLTSLNSTDTDEIITNLCNKATTKFGNVAAVCIYPKFVKLTKKCLAGTSVKIATVCNFPGGDEKPESVLQITKTAIHDGANEIDLVIPYKDYMVGNSATTKNIVKQCKEVCGPSILLKVILETGVMNSTSVIKSACEDVINAGADFLKTSTGKVPIGATIEAAKTMLEVIKETKLKLNKSIGFKAAGGVRTLDQASEYLKLADTIMGTNWTQPTTFRFGASSLLDDVIKELG